MKLTIDNHDGRGAVDYSACVAGGSPFRILRRLNEPVTCTVTLVPAPGLAAPVRNGRMAVSDDSGQLLFTGYLAAEPVLELAGNGTTGPLYRLLISAISDDILLSRQSIPQSGPSYAANAGQMLQTLLTRLQIAGVTDAVSLATQAVSQFQMQSGRSWAENAGALANATRNAWRLMNGTLTMVPVGSVTHSLSEAAGSLSVSSLAIAASRALANDITVCGEQEPCAYVTEFFEGDGTSVLFNLTREPWLPPAAQRRPVAELFDGPVINGQLWMTDDPGASLALTANGLTCAGGGGAWGSTMLTAVSPLELGGSLIIEAAGVQFGAQTSGIINGCYDGGGFFPANCVFGFQISQPSGTTTISPLVNGTVAGSSFTPAAGHLYTLRLRFYAAEMQRILQAYYAAGTDNDTLRFGADYIVTDGKAVLEVQDTSNGIAAAPVILYSGSVSIPPPTAPFVPLNAGYLQCSIGSITVGQQGPVWVTRTSLNGPAVVQRLGTAADGADCAIDDLGRLVFYPLSTPRPGDLIAISYRTAHRSAGRIASSTSIASESAGGGLPGTACWLGSVTNPPPRSSADCENAARAMLAVSTSRAAAWIGHYTAWSTQLPADVWPGDVLAVDAVSAGLTASLVVRSVQIDLSCTAPALVKYTIGFANDWADEIAVKTSNSIPADVWLPQQPLATAPLASLNGLTVAAITGSQIQIDAGTTPPPGGGFEVRRRDWAFTAGPGRDLVLRSPVPGFTIPRQSAIEQYYIRMYDGATPRNYSRFSSAVFVNLPLSNP